MKKDHHTEATVYEEEERSTGSSFATGVLHHSRSILIARLAFPALLQPTNLTLSLSPDRLFCYFVSKEPVLRTRWFFLC